MVYYKYSQLKIECINITKPDFANEEDAVYLLNETFEYLKSKGLSENDVESADIALLIETAKEIWSKLIQSKNLRIINAFRDWDSTIVDNEKVILEVRKRVESICHKYVLSNSGQRKDVEDLVTDVLIRFRNNCLKSDFQLIDKDTGKSIYYPKYIYGIIRFAWLDRLKEKKKEGVSYEELDNLIAEKVEELELDSRIPSLKKAINSLSKVQKKTIALFYLENLTIREVAKYLGISEVAVKKRLYDGRDKLKNILSNRIEE